MSANPASMPDPYMCYEHTLEWKAIDRALSELSQNNVLEEKTAQPYIVGYLCKALVDAAQETPKQKLTHEQGIALLAALQEEFRKANPTGRDPLAELSAERLEAAHRGERGRPGCVHPVGHSQG